MKLTRLKPRPKVSFSLLIFSLFALAGCGGSDNAPVPPSPVAIVRALATVGPTATLSDTQIEATRTAQPPTRTPAPTVMPATPTAYVGVFLGEAQFDPLVQPRSGGEELLTLPTSSRPDSIPLLCAIEQDPAFGVEWKNEFNLENEMNCPIQESSTFEGTVQFFQSGVMYFNPFTNEVWAISPGTLGEAGEFWSVGTPQTVVPAVLPPEGLRVPQGAFGAIWATVPQVRDNLGFAITEEQPNQLKTQRFIGGTLLLDATAGQVFVLAVDGDAFGPF